MSDERQPSAFAKRFSKALADLTQPQCEVSNIVKHVTSAMTYDILDT